MFMKPVRKSEFLRVLSTYRLLEQLVYRKGIGSGPNYQLYYWLRNSSSPFGKRREEPKDTPDIIRPIFYFQYYLKESLIK